MISLLKNKITETFTNLRLGATYFMFFKFKISGRENRLLIIKNDAIGDYIIFRNFVEELRHTRQFEGYEFYILSTAKLVPLIKSLDPAVYKEVIPFGYTTKSVGERIRFFFQLKKYKFRYVIHPTYSPDWLSQELVKYSAATYTIGFKGDGLNLSEKHKTYFDTYYTQLISVTDKAIHEFDKQKEFFNQLVKRPISLARPSIKMEIPVSPKQVTICPGAQAVYRRWSTDNFRQTIQQLHSQDQGLEFTVLTGPGEEHLFQAISKGLPFPVKHVNNPDFTTLCQVLKQSQLVLCNDSAPAHFSVALDVVNICISNGNHYKRFVPYPAACHTRQTVLVPDEVLALDGQDGINPFYHGSTLNINLIPYTSVVQACQKVLND